MIRVATIIGSTRPNRNGQAVAKWVYELSKNRDDAEFKLIDPGDFNLPLLDEPLQPSIGQYTKPHTIKWAETIASFDAYVFRNDGHRTVQEQTEQALKKLPDFF